MNTEKNNFKAACESAIEALCALSLMENSPTEAKVKAQSALSLVSEIHNIG
jgi:hypothetical protein